MTQYKDIPEVQQALQPIADSLNQKYADAEASATAAARKANDMLHSSNPRAQAMLSQLQADAVQKPITMSTDDNDAWTKALGDAVDGLGKQDQMGMINIQEFNSQINQTKQIASALLDAADKSANAIISHIS